MGCASSKKDGESEGRAGLQPPPAVPTVNKGMSKSTLEPEALEDVKNHRTSVRYQAKEIDKDRGSASSGPRRSSAPFDKAHIGTKTRHGVMPGPRGISNAKINQDRGVVCWPFCGSLNEALLCVFDGHGPKGELASEFCMTQLPSLLEKDHDALLADPVACLTKNICDLDEILFSGELGRIAMSCGTTSNVLYLKGEEVWVACSGDSRAIKVSRSAGKIIGTDLSNDHKPDLPVEKARIVAAGGTVTPSGPGARPSRVWANGRVGLAMSRSIGDGECKKVGVIPDPEIQRFVISPATDTNSDGDLCIIVASDGVWEFISTQEAAELVSSHEHATAACEMLVTESTKRWRALEGNYRDDITAIVANVPFLEDWGAQAAEDEEGAGGLLINQGARGYAKLRSKGGAPAAAGALDTVAGATMTASTSGQQEDDEEEFAARRLSVHNPYGEEDDWENEEDEDDDEDN